jgi:phage host-nuclease inhibitor protein Gam
MSNFINKILGKDETESHSGVVIKTQAGGPTRTNETHVQGQTDSGTITVDSRTTQHDGVNITSTVSSDVASSISMTNQQKINDLVRKLGTTHNQIDEYSKKQSAKINEEIQREIDQVLARIRREQQDLLHKANERTAAIDRDYRERLQKMVEEIDAKKAQEICDIERDLNDQQSGLLQSARDEIDRLNEKAANLKIGAIQQAQANAAEEVNQITAQASNLGEGSTVHRATGTTTIKTEVSGGTKTKDANVTTTGAIVTGSKTNTETKTVEGTRQQTTTTKK